MKQQIGSGALVEMRALEQSFGLGDANYTQSTQTRSLQCVRVSGPRWSGNVQLEENIVYSKFGEPVAILEKK